MNRNDDYELNKNEEWIYHMAQTIVQYDYDKNNLTKQNVNEAIQEAIEIGMNRRITNDFNENLIQNRLYNWFAV
jgi:hypothetical protein